jgi:hypothetical protein
MKTFSFEEEEHSIKNQVCRKHNPRKIPHEKSIAVGFTFTTKKKRMGKE